MDTAAETVELTFVDHLKEGVNEQAVFVEKEAGSDQVWRVTPAERDSFLSAPLYASTTHIEPNPMDDAAVGPYPKGPPLGFTLGDWLAASGAGTYTCEDGQGILRTNFQNLVPNVTYTMWYFFQAVPATDPFTTYDLPFGKRDGSDAIFKSDAEGNGTYELTFEPCLQLSGTQLDAALGIAYHSDGKTHGLSYGEFGHNSHIQLFTMLPKG